MSAWIHDYCLTCDKLVDHGRLYCSAKCRMTDHQNSSPPSPTTPSSEFISHHFGFPYSHQLIPPPRPELLPTLAFPATSKLTGFYLPPPVDFTRPLAEIAPLPVRQPAVFRHHTTSSRHASVYPLTTTTKVEATSIVPHSLSTRSSASSLQSYSASIASESGSGSMLLHLRNWGSGFDTARWWRSTRRNTAPSLGN